MYKDKFGNLVKESGVCTINPDDENQIIFVKTGNVYEFINGVMDTDNPFVKEVGNNDNYSDIEFDELPTPLDASILIEDNDKLRWEH